MQTSKQKVREDATKILGFDKFEEIHSGMHGGHKLEVSSEALGTTLAK